MAVYADTHICPDVAYADGGFNLIDLTEYATEPTLADDPTSSRELIDFLRFEVSPKYTTSDSRLRHWLDLLTDEDIVNFARTVCGWLDDGHSPSTVHRFIMEENVEHWGFEEDQGDLVFDMMMASTLHSCTDQYYIVLENTR